MDLIAIRLLSFAAYIEQQVRAGDPAFDVHRDEDHAGGNRAAAAYVLANRATLLAET